ncbi:MAG: SNF2-related protein [Synechococcus sp.]|nr:SNF2-related protein [Synechococcus sp.]
MAVIYGCSNRAKIVQCLNQLGGQTPLTEVSLRPHVKALEKEQLIIAERGKGSRCNPLVAEPITAALAQQGKLAAIATVVQKVFDLGLAKLKKFTVFRDFEDCFQVARLTVYQDDPDTLQLCVDQYNEDMQRVWKQNQSFWHVRAVAPESTTSGIIFETITNRLAEPNIMQGIAPRIAAMLLIDDLQRALFNLDDISLNLVTLEATLYRESASDIGKFAIICAHLLQGNLSEAETVLSQSWASSQWSLQLQGWLKCIQGDIDASIQLYAQAQKQAKKQITPRQWLIWEQLAQVFYILALLQHNQPQSLVLASELSGSAQTATPELASVYQALFQVIAIQQCRLAARQILINIPFAETTPPLARFFVALAKIYGDRSPSEQAQQEIQHQLNTILSRSEKYHYRWLAAVTMDLQVASQAALSNKQVNACQEKVRQLQGDNQWHSWQNLFPTKEPWELSLNALANLGSSHQPTRIEGETRLAWFLDIDAGWLDLEAREQKIKTNGQWGRGRAIAKRRLQEELETFSYFTPQDRNICNYLKSYRNYNYYGSDVTYEWKESVLLALVDHAHVYLKDRPTIRLDVKKGEVQLRVEKRSEEQLALSLEPPLDPASQDVEIITVQETPTRLRVYPLTPELLRVAEVLGPDNHLTVPLQAKEQVLAAINGMANLLTIHSDIGGSNIAARTVEAQATPHIHLFPFKEGLRVSILVCPFGEQGPYYHPGKGGELVVAEVAGERLQTQRDFEEEAGLAFDVLQACPILMDATREAGELLVEDPQDCLELLASLQQMGDRLVVEWPQGEKFSITHYASASNFQAQIRQQQDWFALDGELHLSDELILDMQHLLKLLENTPGRFIQLDQGKFLALTDEFRRRLDDLRAFSDVHQNQLRIHPLAAFALDEFTDEIQLDADEHWRKHIERIRNSDAIHIEVPSTLQAELRDYQVEGYHWLMRLAHWQMGACLADDMGLGKTLQTLTALLARAPQGPSLVIAPTSVCPNWISEALTFAPTLNPILFGSGDRQTTIDQLKPFDLVICSYGLLQQDEVAAILAGAHWCTIVLDEAQAIKNSATKRAKAATQLQGDFKIITTGTPIENHLGELWSLFRFINPGLLGSRKKFNERFANAIELSRDRETKLRLQKLIKPFILRRTKTQVLTELPSRTEITLSVALNPEEMAMYEALRRDALDKLMGTQAAAGAKHLQVLAEIMRLRRMCCNPRLVVPNTTLTGSKLQVFGETLEELLSNHHKALVFSQFVDHLAILRDYLAQKKITYQYLDGRTPQKKRQQAINAFQAGEGDVFLISLKAGGTGLNLTAADYVIHMDPWWNPAVEDQASDRAHRMGQQRPVTIYRLVAKNTIEEKIVDLHRHKRDLANSLLEGTDAGGQLSTDELIQLLQEV